MEQEKNKGGRPRKEIDTNWLRKLCEVQCTGEECASFFEMDYDTLNDRIKELGYNGFSEYFKKHSGTGKVSLRRNQYLLSKTNAAMSIWLGKQWLGQKDIITETGQEDNTVIKVEIVRRSQTNNGE